MRKIKSVQHFTGTESVDAVTDYPSHSRKMLAARVDQGIIESQMPEHVTVLENTHANGSGSVTDYPSQQSAGHPPSKPRHNERRRVHAYEQVEESFEGEGQVSHHSVLPSKVNTLKGAVKRMEHWSPGLPKHSNDRARQDKTHAKTATLERIEIKPEGGAKRKAFLSRGKNPPTSGADDVGQQQQSEVTGNSGVSAEVARGRRGSRDSREEWSPQETGVSKNKALSDQSGH